MHYYSKSATREWKLSADGWWGAPVDLTSDKLQGSYQEVCSMLSSTLPDNSHPTWCPLKTKMIQYQEQIR